MQSDEVTSERGGKRTRNGCGARLMSRNATMLASLNKLVSKPRWEVG
jgi:hypothetical protein